MDVHFCQGKFKRANIFGKAKTCQEVKDCLIRCSKKTASFQTNNSCSKDGDHKGCCNNESFDFDLDLDAYEIIPVHLNAIQKQFFSINNYALNFITTKDVSKFKTYIPPPLEKDIDVLFQVFRL